MTDPTNVNASNPPAEGVKQLHPDELQGQTPPVDPAKISEHLDQEAADRAQDAQPDPEPMPDFSRTGGYELEVPSYVPASEIHPAAQGVLAEYSVLSKELGIPSDQAQQLLETFVDGRLALPSGMYPGTNANECTSILRRARGREFDPTTKILRDAAQAMGPKFMAWLEREQPDGSTLGNDPAVAQAVLAYAKGLTRLSPAQAQAALDKVLKDKAHPYWQGNPNAVAEVRELRKRVSGTAGKASAQSTVKAPAPPTARQQIEQRIAAIRSDPAYISDNKVLRQNLMAEMTRLYTQLAAAKEEP